MDTNTDEQRRLVRLLDTLPERLALARSNRLPHHDFLEMLLTDEGTVNLRSCGRSANHKSLIGHTRPGESRTRTGENRPRIAQVDSARRRDGLHHRVGHHGVTRRYRYLQVCRTMRATITLTRANSFRAVIILCTRFSRGLEDDASADLNGVVGEALVVAA